MARYTETEKLAIFCRDGMCCVYCGEGVVVGKALKVGVQEGQPLTACEGCHTYRLMYWSETLREFCDRLGWIGLTGKDIYDRVMEAMGKDWQEYLPMAKQIRGEKE